MSKNKHRNKNIINNAKQSTVNNGLETALDLPCDNYFSNPLVNPTSLFYNSSPILLTMFWQELTYAYKSNGFIQTTINQIVDDAFRNDGLIIDSKTLTLDELDLLHQTQEEEGDIDAIKDCIRWSQLYGGGVVIANTEQDPSLPLDLKLLKGKPLKLLATDRWQCQCNGIAPELSQNFTLVDNLLTSNKGGFIIDSSRISISTGVKAPYLLRSMLNGWGLSIFEAVIPSLVQYLKAMGVTLELLDEAKIDIIKINELASSLLSPEGEAQVRKRLSIVSQNKNYKSSIAMDSNDDYEQKQISFSGLPEMIVQIQYLVCAALKRPYSKVFGKGSSGFSSGDDDLENYNTIVDSEIRFPNKRLIKWCASLRCAQLFGRIPPDLRISWKPLRVMSEKDEAEIKSRKLADYLQLVDRQIMTKQQAAQHLTQDGIVLFSPEEIATIDNTFEPYDYNNVEDLLID